MPLSICLSIYLGQCVVLIVFMPVVFLSFYLSIPVYIPTYMPLSICLSVSLRQCPAFIVSAAALSLSFYLSLSVYAPTHISLSIYLSVSLRQCAAFIVFTAALSHRASLLLLGRGVTSGTPPAAAEGQEAR